MPILGGLNNLVSRLAGCQQATIGTLNTDKRMHYALTLLLSFMACVKSNTQVGKRHAQALSKDTKYPVRSCFQPRWTTHMRSACHSVLTQQVLCCSNVVAALFRLPARAL